MRRMVLLVMVAVLVVAMTSCATAQLGDGNNTLEQYCVSEIRMVVGAGWDMKLHDSQKLAGWISKHSSNNSMMRCVVMTDSKVILSDTLAFVEGGQVIIHGDYYRFLRHAQPLRVDFYAANGSDMLKTVIIEGYCQPPTSQHSTDNELERYCVINSSIEGSAVFILQNSEKLAEWISATSKSGSVDCTLAVPRQFSIGHTKAVVVNQQVAVIGDYSNYIGKSAIELAINPFNSGHSKSVMISGYCQ